MTQGSNFKPRVLGSLTGENIDDLIYWKYPEMADLLLDLVECESRWKHDGQWGDNFQSYGAFQYQEKTFDEFCKGDWKDMEDQLDCAVEMIKKGLGPKTIGWYNCWRIANLWKYF